MAFPLAESFNGADETALSTHNPLWALVNGSVAAIRLTGNRGYSFLGGNLYYYNDPPPSANYAVASDIHVLSTGVSNSNGVAGRMLTNTPTYYVARLQRVSSTSAQWQLLRFNAGVLTQLGSNVPQAFAAGNVFRLELRMQGAEISVYVDGVLTIGPITDPAPLTAAGFAGIRSGDSSTAATGYHIENWSATAIETAATAITLSGPSGGNVGVASSAFTVGANGTLAGSVTVTPSDGGGGGGGTFTPTSVTISPASPTATFTYTPGSAGAKTISVTNSGGLSNPSALTYTASVPAATTLALTVPDAAGLSGFSGVVLSAAAPGAGVTVLRTITGLSFNGSGQASIDITGLGVSVGAYRWVSVTNSNGVPGQSPAPVQAQGPVIAS